MLWIFDRVKNKHLAGLISFSFVAEVLLLSSIFFLQNHLHFILVLGTLNGIYSALFWTTQRLTFYAISDKNNTGSKFGNLQILVFLVLKTAIIISALLLENEKFKYIFIFSFIINGISIFYLSQYKTDIHKLQKKAQSSPISLKEIKTFKDKYNSPLIFILDGPFLFLESYFWTLSLFFITNQNIFHFGILFVILAIFFGISFWAIKEKIDKISNKSIYQVAVTGYIIAWIIRSILDNEIPLAGLIVSIIALTFFTSFFRLMFNKKFFDIAHKNKDSKYIFIKSYYSQFSIFITFGVFTGLLYKWPEVLTLSTIYLVASGFAVLFFCYKFPPPK